MEIWIVTLILIITIFLLITEKLPYDVTSIGIMAALSLTRILTPVESVAGFANPALITVAAMFLISRGMIRTGAIEFLGNQVTRLAGDNGKTAIYLVFLIVALSSAFMNNTPVVVLFIPVLISMCCRFNMSPSQYLLPLSYTSILAGTCTLIGTSTNIIVSDLSAEYGYGTIGMFELAKVGLPLAVVGIGFILISAAKILPNMANPACELEKKGHRKYLSQIRIPAQSRLIGKKPDLYFSAHFPSLETVELVRKHRIFHPLRDKVRMMKQDLLLIKGSAKDLVHLMEENDTVRVDRQNARKQVPGEDNITVEFIIPPNSSLVGDRLKQTQLHQESQLAVIAIQRSGLQYTERNIQDIRLRVGDILLVNLPWSKLDDFRHNSDVIIIEDIHHTIVLKNRAHYAGIIFLTVVLTASTGLLNIMVSAMAGVFLMFVTNCLQVRDAYRSLQGNILMLIAGTIALGTALEKTGASRLYAETLIRLMEGFPPGLILGVIILLTSIFTQLLSNNATAVLILPVAISAATTIGVDPKPFIIAVCFGASACFASPLGYQTNLLVYGPGGYRFIDYLKLGIPLNLMILIFGTLMIPVFWPF